MAASFPRARATGSRPSSACAVFDSRDRRGHHRHPPPDGPTPNYPGRADARGKEEYEIITERAAPRGYFHVPIGTEELAVRCRELSKQRGENFYTVNSPTYGRNVGPQRVTYHLQRKGYHFTKEIVEQAMSELGYHKTEDGFRKVAEIRHKQRTQQIVEMLEKQGRLDDVKRFREQNERQEEVESARRMVKEIFPCIPDADLNDVMQRAWQEGSDRVGNAKHMPLERKAQLAVVARIRHIYTDYDRLIKAFGWDKARELVEQSCIQKLIEWRGENVRVGVDETDFVEFLMETIIIPDGDDDDDVIFAGERAVDKPASRQFGDPDSGFDSIDERIRRKRSVRQQDSSKQQQFARELLQDARKGLQKDRAQGSERQQGSSKRQEFPNELVQDTPEGLQGDAAEDSERQPKRQRRSENLAEAEKEPLSLQERHRQHRQLWQEHERDAIDHAINVQTHGLEMQELFREFPRVYDAGPEGFRSLDPPLRVVVQPNESGQVGQEMIFGGQRFIRASPSAQEQPVDRYARTNLHAPAPIQPRGHPSSSNNTATAFALANRDGHREVVDLTAPDYVDLTSPPKPPKSRAPFAVDGYGGAPPGLRPSVRDISNSGHLIGQAEPRYERVAQESLAYDPNNPLMVTARVPQPAPHTRYQPNHASRLQPENVDPRKSTPAYTPMHGAPAPIQQVSRDSDVQVLHRYPDGTLAPISSNPPRGNLHHANPAHDSQRHATPAAPPPVNGAPALTQYYRRG